MAEPTGPTGLLTLSQEQTNHIAFHAPPGTAMLLIVAIGVACIIIGWRFRGDTTSREIRRQGKMTRRQNARLYRQQTQQFASMVRPEMTQPGYVRSQAAELTRTVLTVALFAAIIAVLSIFTYGLIEARSLTISATVGAVAAYTWYRYRTRAARAWQRNMVEPLAAGLAPILGYDKTMQPWKQWLEVPHSVYGGRPDFREVKLNRREISGTRVVLVVLGLLPAVAASAAGLPTLYVMAAGLALALALPAYVGPRAEPWVYDRLAPVRLRRDKARDWLAKRDPRASDWGLKREAARTRRAQEAVIRIKLPHTWSANPQQQSDLMGLINARLVGEWEAAWHTQRYYAEIRRAPIPPDTVLFADLIEEIDKCDEGEIILGLDKRGRLFKGSLETDFPHWGFSMGTGAGKSVLLWCIIAQLIRQGARIVGLDPKMISQEPFEAVPGVELHTDPRDVIGMWDAVARVRAEMEARLRQWKSDRGAQFSRLVLVMEELNQFSDMSLAYWRANKSKGASNVPPVWEDVAAILQMGRAVKVNIIAVAQRFDSKATGGYGLRDYFGLRGLGRYTWQAWKMLVGTSPIPRSVKKRGRIIMVDGDEHTWIQAPLSTAQEITTYALTQRERQHWSADLSAVPTLVSDAPLPTPTDAAAGNGSAPERGEGRPRLTVVPDLYSLQDASLDKGIGIVPLTYENLKYHRKTKPDFPAGIQGKNGKQYTADELQQWFYKYNAMRPTGTGE